MLLLVVVVAIAVARVSGSNATGAVFVKDGDHLVLPSLTLGKDGFTLEAWLFVAGSPPAAVIDLGGGFFHPRIALELEASGVASLTIDNRPTREERGTLRTVDAFARVSIGNRPHRQNNPLILWCRTSPCAEQDAQAALT